MLESLTNASRHSGASSCTAELLAQDGALRITVTDDGAGLPAGVRPGVGLDSMRQRADEVGGTLSITAGRGRGLVVNARLPLEDAP